MGLVDNGRYFAQCANKSCKFRVWLIPDPQKSEEASPQLESDVSSSRRWNRLNGQSTPAADPAEQGETRRASSFSGNSNGLFVRRASNGEFLHGRHGMAQLSGHLLGVPAIANKASNQSGSSTPVTSGAEELLEDDDRPRTPPPDLSILWSKRWTRPEKRTQALELHGATGDTDVDIEAVDILEAVEAAEAAQLEEVLCILPDASPELVLELFAEGLTAAQVIDCLCRPAVACSKAANLKCI